MRGEEHPRQLFLDLLDERNPKLKDVEAERDGRHRPRRTPTWDSPSAFPVDPREQARNRELFMTRESKRKQAESVGRDKRDDLRDMDLQERKTG